MTDKQIIIDGVDVSGCGELHINQANTIICEITGYLCEDRQNCYYKQLLRKEQLLEKVKLMLQTIIETNKVYPLQNNLLKLLDIIEGKENE